MAILPGIRPAAKATEGMRPKLKDGAQKSVRFSFRGALKYGFLPGIFPRIRRLGAHFGIMAHMLALILSSAGLLPKGHPMLNPVNTGRFGIVDVLAAAANNIILKRENVDKILIFGAIVLSMILIVIQAVIIAFYSFIDTASAADGGGSNMFTTAAPDTDMVFTFMQQVVGLDDFFNGREQIGFSIAHALHSMLGFYSTAMMLIAVVIVCYYVVTIAGESAQTGQAFGKRFNSLWAPVRLVLALGLLVPLGNGLNSAQYLTLYVAKAGSSLATNAWNQFSTALANPDKTIVPAFPVGMTEIGKRIFLSEVCMAGYNMGLGSAQEMMFVKAWVPQQNAGTTKGIIQNTVPMLSGIETFQNANTNMVSFEWTYTGPYNLLTGTPIFTCGALSLPYTPTSNDPAVDALSQKALKAYAEAVGMIVQDVRPAAQAYAAQYIITLENNGRGNVDADLADPSVLRNAINRADQHLVDELVGSDAREKAKAVLDDVLGDNFTIGGWGVAANYYAKLAHANQTVQKLVRSAAPSIQSVGGFNAQQGLNWTREQESGWGTGNAIGLGGDAVRLLGAMGFGLSGLGERAVDVYAAVSAANTSVVQRVSAQGGLDIPGRNTLAATWENDDGFMSVLKYIFAVDALQAIADPSNVNVFPMVLLNNLGNELINKALWAFAGGTFVSFLGDVGAAVGNMIFILGFIGLGVGFLLGIVLPFMPFIYFFFAIVEWVIGIIEAMVGVPLWALAHLRIDGEGMPGQAAMNGYYIFFGILIKPFVILFSLFASFIIFNAGAYFLNLLFGQTVLLIAANGDESAYNGLNPIQFVGYLIVYAIIVYNLGLVSFKMIDQIPAQTMRWMGQNNLNYQDGKPDPMGNLSQVTTAASGFVGAQLANSASRLATGTGRVLKGGNFGDGLRARTDTTGGGTPPP